MSRQQFASSSPRFCSKQEVMYHFPGRDWCVLKSNCTYRSLYTKSTRLALGQHAERIKMFPCVSVAFSWPGLNTYAKVFKGQFVNWPCFSMWVYRILSWIHPSWGEVSARFARQCQAEVSRAAQSCPWPGWAQLQEVLNKCRSVLASAPPSKWTFYPAFAFYTNSQPADLLLCFSVVLPCLCMDSSRGAVCILRTGCSMTWKKQSCPWMLSLVTFICTLHLVKCVPTDLQCFSEVQDAFSSQV